jgi:hypothetical protein
VPRAKGVGAMQGSLAEKASQSAGRYGDGKRIENSWPDLHRQVDAQDFVFAEGKALPTRAVAAPSGKRLPANAHQDASQSRIDGIDCPACDQIEDHRCRVFADPAGKDTHRSAKRNVPLVETARQTGERGSTP